MQAKYDRTTRWLHAALACGVVVQLALSAVMHVPPGPGLGTNDWHRKAFELHAKVGPWVGFIVALHWLWLLLPQSRPGLSYLFPWASAETRRVLFAELESLVRLRIPPPAAGSPLVGTVHGLGLAAVTGSAMCGITLYLGYFVGIAIPRPILHGVALAHLTFGFLMWTFVIAHGSMALVHWIARPASQGLASDR
ncbi:MAG: cytochrome b/b6 domain-containing protein [Pseudomonadota bacterium]